MKTKTTPARKSLRVRSAVRAGSRFSGSTSGQSTQVTTNGQSANAGNFDVQ